jgi:hypothetical protein
MGYLVCAVVSGLALCAALVILELFKYGREKGSIVTLKITAPEDLDFPNAFDSILQAYTTSARLKRIKTADLGSVYELNYAVVMKAGANEKEFIDDLRCRNGNMNIALVMEAPSGAEF